MISIKLLQDRLASQYVSGKTDAELAKIAGCSTTHINNLRNCKRSIGGASLDLLLKLFPDLDKAIADACSGNTGNTNIVNGNGNIGVTQTIGDNSIDAYQLRLYQGLASLDIPDDAKAKVLGLIKSAAKKE